ncbi:MAG: hypothetical protein RJA22_757 [Verrucomicrobiota bacterium]|jgi:hypothetical protein
MKITKLQLNTIRRAGRGWVAAAIGVLGILGGPRQAAWASNITFREIVRNTDFATAGVGGMRNVGSGTISLTGVTGTVQRAWLYWAGPSNPTNAAANAAVSIDGKFIMGEHIGTTSDNSWGYKRSFAYRADVTDVVAPKKNGAYSLSGFMKQGTNVNVNGASLMVFYQDPHASNNRDIVLYDGNDSNAPNGYDSSDWVVLLRGIRYTNGIVRLQMHVSDGQTYRDPALFINGRTLVSEGTVFSGASVPGDNNGPLNNGRLWDIKSWDVTRFLGVGTNYLRLGHGFYSSSGDCVALVAAIMNLPAGAAPPDDPTLTNRAPAVTAEPVQVFNTPKAITLQASVSDLDGDSLITAISMNNKLMSTGTIARSTPITIGTLSLTCPFDLGSNQVVFAATDGDLSGTAVVQVNIVDNTMPTLNVPADITTTTGPGESKKTVTFSATASDDFGSVSVSCAPPSGYSFPIGVTTVSCSAVDGSGNTARAEFRITVLDGQAPTLACPADMSRPAIPGGTTAIVTYSVSAQDTDPNVVVTCAPPSGSTFALGTTPVTCTATDSSGNASTCTFRVAILDQQAPVITVPTNMVVANDAGRCSAVVEYTATVTDNVPGAILLCVPPSGSEFPAGTNLVQCTATDAAGNTAVKGFCIKVTDSEGPRLTVPADITVPCSAGKANAVVTFNPTATDNCSAATVTSVPASGSVFAVGTNTVRCTAVDAAGNRTLGSFRVIVLDTEAPVIKSITPTNKVLWPPNHKMVPVSFSVNAVDNCGWVTNCIIAVKSNQPVDGGADGTTAPDYIITGSLSVSVLSDLRSERDGSTGDRIYTVTIQTKDRAGNAATRDVYVTVPKSYKTVNKK